MSASNFFKAREDHSEYHDVCDIRKGERTPTNVHKAFAGLKCEGNELHEWTSQRREFTEKFKKAKQCLERRLSTMKRFSARSEKNKTSRKRHIYPIQVAYTYGKDCLKKFATQEQQQAFTNSVDELIDDISKKRNNVRGYFGNSIENSIRGRKNIPDIKELLNSQYYNADQLELINKARKVGNNEAKLAPNNREKYLSLFNEGFSRGNAAARAAALEEALENESESESESENEAVATAAAEKPRRRKKKSKTLKAPSRPVNNTTLNEVLESQEFKPNNAAVNAEINKRMDKLEKLFIEKSLIDEKMFYIEDIYYAAFSTIDRVNRNLSEKEQSLGSLGLASAARKLASNEKYLNAADASKQRTELRKSIEKVHVALKEKYAKILDEIDELLKSNNTNISYAVTDYFTLDLPTVVLEKTEDKIHELSAEERKKFKDEFDELSKIKPIFESINTELLEIEVKINKNSLQQTKIKDMLKSNIIKARPNVVESTQKKLDTLKSEETELYKLLLKIYKKKTDKIYDILQQVNTKYQNPYILIQNINTSLLRSLSSLLLGR